jgi:hypothetical protein
MHNCVSQAGLAINGMFVGPAPAPPPFDRDYLGSMCSNGNRAEDPALLYAMAGKGPGSVKRLAIEVLRDFRRG